MANSWLKLYHETLNDPKMGTMSDHLYRRTIEIFLLAGQENREGLLPPLTQIAWALRTTVNDVQLCLQELTELGIVTKIADGSWLVTHFSERQNKNLSDAERAAKHREKEKASRELSDARHEADVTPDTLTVTQTYDEPSRPESDGITKTVTVDTDTDKDTDIDTEEEALLNNLNIKNNMTVKPPHAAPAAAREKQTKPKLTPDQPEFWQRAFGPEADRAKAFSNASGIIPIGTEFGRWQKDLRAFTDAGITIVTMVEAVRKVRKDGKYPIKAPGTVLTEARNLVVSAPSVSKKTTSDYLEELEWEGCNE